MDTLVDKLAEHAARGERACDALDRAVQELRRLRKGVGATRSALVATRPAQLGGSTCAAETAGSENAVR
jgi:hypothetical protein